MPRSSVVDYLHCERGANDLPTFFFSRFDDSISLSAETVLRSIIRQSLQLDDVTGEIEKQLSDFENSYTDMYKIEKLLHCCISRFTTVYIVIDGLDEFEEVDRKILFQTLSSIISLPNSQAKLFLVGRSSISTDIQKWFPECQMKYVSCRDVQADIGTYIQQSIFLKLEEKDLMLHDPDLAREIIEALTKGADGMYVPTS